MTGPAPRSAADAEGGGSRTASVSPGAASAAPAVRIGQWLFRWRNVLFPLVLLALLGGFRPAAPARGRFDWLDLAGLGVALAGQGLRVAVIGYAYIRRGGKDGQVYATRLVTGGFFAHCRNPLYLGNLLILFGLFMLHDNPWVYLLGGAFFVGAYSAIVAAEEAYLGQRFGAQYAEYCRQVSRWRPGFRGLGRSIEAMRFDWRRVVVKEYGSAYAWTAGAVLVLVNQGLPGLTGGALAAAASALVLLTAGWGLARYYKKRVASRSVS